MEWLYLTIDEWINLTVDEWLALYLNPEVIPLPGPVSGISDLSLSSTTNTVPCSAGVAVMTYFEPYLNEMQSRSITPLTGAYLPAITVCRQDLFFNCNAFFNYRGLGTTTTNQALLNLICSKSVPNSQN